MSNEVALGPVNQGSSEIALGPVNNNSIDLSGFDMSNIGTAAQTNPEHKDPLTAKQNFLASLPSTVQGRFHALTEMGIPAEMAEDGKTITVNGESWGDIHSPQDFVNNLPENISRFAARNMPLIGSSIALAVGGPAAGLGAMTALSAGGAAAGSLTQQVTATSITGDKIDLGETLYQTAMGAASPIAGKAVGKVAEIGLKALQKPLNIILKKSASVYPEIAETLWGLEKGNTAEMIAQFKGGKPISEIIGKTIDGVSIENANIPQKLAQRIFAKGKPTLDIDNFISAYKMHLNNITDKANINVLDEGYRGIFPGLKQETLEAIKKYNTSDLLSNKYSSDNALSVVGKQVREALEIGQRNTFEEAYGSAIKKFYDNGNKMQVDISSDYMALKTMLGPSSSNNPNGIGALLADGKINSHYGNPTERNAIQQLLNLFDPEKRQIMEQLGGISKSFSKQITIEDLVATGQKFSVGGKIYDPTPMTKMDASRVYELFRDAKSPLNQIFKAEGGASKPVEMFRKSLASKLGGINQEFNDITKKYAEFSLLKDEMGNLTKSRLGDMYKDGNLTTAVRDIDNLLGTRILPEVEKLGAAQDLQGFRTNGLNEGIKNFTRNIKDINNIKNESKALIREAMGQFEKVVATPFMEDAKFHSIASDLANQPTSWFRIKSLGFFLSGVALHNPVVGIAGGAFLANPRNAVKILEMAGPEGAATAMAAGKAVGKKATSITGQAILGKLMRKATGD